MSGLFEESFKKKDTSMRKCLSSKNFHMFSHIFGRKNN